MSDIDRFELFLYVARAESLTQAAIQLSISKASLSKQIKKLERDLQVDLFVRTGQRLHLTPQGELLLTQCGRLKKELDDTRSICQQFHEEPEGELKIVAFEYFADRLIFPYLTDFLNRYPKLALTIDTSERIPNFEKEQVDLALGFSLPVPNSEEIIQCRMGTTGYALCASPQYLKENGRPQALDDLKNHKQIFHTGRTKEKLKLKPGYKVDLQPHLQINSVTAMLACAIAGVGIIQLPMYLISD